MPKPNSDKPVSPNNPCPFLRALVQQGLLKDDTPSAGEVASTIVNVAKTGQGSPSLPSLPVRAIALIANGFGPLSLAQSILHGVKLNELRGGPLDKKGSGSRILDSNGVVDEAELEHLAEFASDKESINGTLELGLDADDLVRFMDDNFSRAQDNRRAIDRKLMDAEWPVLLKVIGKDGQHGRYLSVAAIRDLFKDRTLPERMMKQLRTT